MSDVSSLLTRIRGLERLLNFLSARVAALEARVAALEQGLTQRWYQ